MIIIYEDIVITVYIQIERLDLRVKIINASQAAEQVFNRFKCIETYGCFDQNNKQGRKAQTRYEKFSCIVNSHIMAQKYRRTYISTCCPLGIGLFESGVVAKK